MAQDVFISYSHHDKSAADAVCAKLEQHGIRCWIAPRDVEPGTEWAGSIIHAINKTKIMVLVFSKNANESLQIRREVERAVNKGVIVVPLRIENVVPTESLEYFRSNVHWLDALTPPLENHLDHLAGTVKIILDRMVIRDEPTPHAPAVPNVDRSVPVSPPLPPPEVPKISMLDPAPVFDANVREKIRSKSRGILLAGAALLTIALLAIVYFGWISPASPFRKDRTLAGHADSIFSIAFSPDSKFLASGSADKTIKLWDPTTGSIVRTLTGSTEIVESVAFSSSGTTFASGSFDGKIILWDTSTAAELKTLQSDDHVYCVAVNPDGGTIASGGASANVKLWMGFIDYLGPALPGHVFAVHSLAFSPRVEDYLLAAASGDAKIRLWHTPSSKLVRTFTGHNGSVNAVVFSPDAKILASGGLDHTVKFWDVSTGREIRTLAGHTEEVLSVAFSPDGRYLASASRDRTVKLWEAATGRLIATLKDHAAAVFSVAFSPDGKWLASSSMDKTIVLYRRTD